MDKEENVLCLKTKVGLEETWMISAYEKKKLGAGLKLETNASVLNYVFS